MTFGLENHVAHPYLRAAIILIAAFAILRLSAFILERIALKLTSKTKTNVDDLFIKKSSIYWTILVFLIGIRLAIEELMLSPTVEKYISKSLYSLDTIVIAIILYYFVDIVLFAALKKALKGTNFEAEASVKALLKNVLRIILVIIVFLYILTIWGVAIGPFLAGLGIAGLAVALALQPVLSNIFSGASIVLDKTVKSDDLIYLDQNTKGKVQHVGMRSTRILTFDNELLIVPNNKLAEMTIQNVAQPEPEARVVVPFSVAYGTDIDKVKTIILEQIKQVKHCQEKPKPFIRFIEMGTSSLNFKAYFYVPDYDKRFKAIDEANTRIYNTLRKHRIEIPFPQMDVRIRK